MSELRYSPEEFARLMSLPKEHPDRQRAEDTPMFDAWVRMHAEFDAPRDVPISPGERSGAVAELTARLERAIGVSVSTADVETQWRDRGRPAVPADSMDSAAGGGILDAITRWFTTPALRPVLAGGIAVVLAGVVWWSVSRGPAPRVERSVEARDGAPVLAPPRPVEGGVELSWSATPGADAYRLAFLGSDLREIARLDGLAGTSVVLKSDALPDGVQPGAEVQLEVTALLRGDPLAVSKTRSIRLP